MFETHMRPLEANALRQFQLIPPMPHLRGTGACWSLLIRASELGRPCNTGEIDMSVALDLPCHQNLVVRLQKLHRQLGLQAAVFSMNVARTQLGLTLYSCGHGGASEDRVWLLISTRNSETRGWKSFTVRRYKKHARPNLTLSKVRAGMLREVTHVEAQLLVAWIRLWNRRVLPSGYRQAICSWLAFPSPFPSVVNCNQLCGVHKNFVTCG